MRRWMHILLDSAVISAALGIPFLCSDTFSRMISGKTDAVTSASVILDAPSGDYLVLVNLDRHQDAENLALWETFFTGTDAPVIYEDISCLTALGDRGGDLRPSGGRQQDQPRSDLRFVYVLHAHRGALYRADAAVL